jgi:hypothetical protein
LKRSHFQFRNIKTEHDEPEMSFRRGYQQGAIEVFYAIERFLDPARRKVLQALIEKDVYIWRVKAMLGRPPKWRLTAAFSAGSDGDRKSPQLPAQSAHVVCGSQRLPNNRDSSVPIGDAVDGVPRIGRPTIEPDRIVEPAMFEPFLAALMTVRAQRLQLTIPEFDRIVVMRLGMVRDTCRDDLAFAQAHRTKRLVLKLTARPAMPRGFVVQPAHSTKSPC